VHHLNGVYSSKQMRSPPNDGLVFGRRAIIPLDVQNVADGFGSRVLISA
jgi:hypothetical protein